MNFNTLLQIEWASELPEALSTRLIDFINQLADNGSFVSINTTLASGMYDYYSVGKLYEFFMTDDTFADYIQHIQSSRADETSTDRFLVKVHGLDSNPKDIIDKVWNEKLYSHRLNDRPYWGDFFSYMHNKLDQIYDPTYITMIEALRDNHPNAYNITLDQITESFEKFKFFGDNRDFIKIVLADFNPEYDAMLREQLPECIQNLKIRLSLQVMYNGTFCQIHRDHDRVATLFWLVTEPVAETRYYLLHPKFSRLRYKLKLGSYGPSHTMEQFKTIIQPNNWYLFNNAEIHSVHNFDPAKNNGGLRIAYTVDFYDMDYHAVAKILLENGITFSNVN